MKNLKNVLKQLKEIGFEVRPQEIVEKEIASAFFKEIVLTTSRFEWNIEVLYVTETDEFKLCTTFSNQHITTEYLNVMSKVLEVIK